MPDTPATPTDPGRRYARPDDPNVARGLETRARLHSAAWAAHQSGERLTPAGMAARAGMGRTTVDFHARRLAAEGRWPWDWPRVARDRAAPRLPPDVASGLAADPASLRLARRIWKSAARGNPRLADEYESAALAALWDAAIGYDGRPGTSFEVFASIRLKGAMRHVTRSANERGFRDRRHPAAGTRQPAVLSMDRPVGGGAAFGDMLPSGDLPVGWEIEALDEVEYLASKAAPEDGRILRDYFTRCDLATVEDLARHRGAAWDTIYAARKRAMGAVRRHVTRMRGVAG